MPDLIDLMEQKGRDFNFFQAVTLLEEYFHKKGNDKNPLHSGRIQFASHTDTSFPSCDIASIRRDDKKVVRILLYFMGLLGVSSPLPQYFTEYATRHDNEETALANFLSIFNHRMYVLFYLAWKKYRLVNSASARDQFGLIEKIALLASLQDQHLSRWKKLISYTGILAGSCRSAEGLKTMLADYFGEIPVSIQQWMPRWAPVTELKQIGVDSVLGSTAMAGTHVRDVGGKFRIVLGPLERECFEKFLPDKPDIKELQDLVKLYMTDPLEFDVEVQLKPADLVPVVLGNSDAALGITSSCGRSSEKSEPYAIVIGN